ncbi:MAG: insulinase family protein [Alphaproteobacteria bacterium]|nr:insulinase family protein [Alphaproteobacteria bacterium]
MTKQTEMQTTTLESGLRIVTDPVPSVETTAVGVWVAAGTRHETIEVNGISHLLEHMAFKGTNQRTAYQIAEQMDNVGGQLNAYTSRDHTAYYAKVLKEDLPLAVDILSDILLDATMDEEEFAREQQVVVQEIYQSEDTPDDIVFDRLQSTAYPDQALGWPVLGTVESVNRMTADNLHDYMGRNYTSGDIVVSASGRVDHDVFVGQVATAFQELTKGDGPQPVQAKYVGGDVRETRPVEQLHVVLGFDGVGYHDPDYYPLSALSVLFGEGLSSRLFQEVREKRGLAYSVFSSTNACEDSGIFTVYAGTGPDQTDELIGVLTDEIKKMAEGATAEEVTRAKAQLKAGLLMGLESPGSRCVQRARQILVYGRTLDTREIIEKVEQIDATAIANAAQRLFATTPTIAAVGQIDRLGDYDSIAARLS